MSNGTDLSETDLDERIRRLEERVLPGGQPGPPVTAPTKGKAINPQSIGLTTPAESMATEQIVDVYDHIISAEDDVVDVINNQASAGESAIVGEGTYTISTSIQPPDDFHLTINGTIKLADGAQIQIIKRTDGPQNIVIDGRGTLDGNKANIGYTGTRSDHVGIFFKSGANTPPKNIAIRDIEIENIVAGAGISVGLAMDGTEPLGENIRHENLYIHDCGKSGVPCDGVWWSVDKGWRINCQVKNVTDTAYAAHTAERYVLAGCIAENTDAFNTDTGGMVDGVTIPNQATTEGRSDVAILGCYFRNLGTANNPAAINTYRNAANARVVGCVFEGDLSRGVQVEDGGRVGISNCWFSDVNKTLGYGVMQSGSGATEACSVTNCFFAGPSNDAISLGDTDQRIMGNHFERVTGQTVVTGGNSVIQGNVVSDQTAPGFTPGSGTVVGGNTPAYYDLDEVITVAASGTALSTAVSRAALGDDVDISVAPNADPNTDLAFDARAYWDDTAGAVKVQVEETTGTGGDARVTAKVE